MKSSNALAALVLFLTPAISVELLTGDTPVESYLTPITFFILNVVYGGALLLLRETVIRWGKGFSSILILAAGYGMENEAITSKGFFDPHFYALDKLEGFGRHFGINIPWAINISIVHAVLSMTIPLVIVSAIFKNKTRWINNKVYGVLLFVFVATSALTFRFVALPPSFYHYQEGPGPLLLILTFMASLIFLAWKLPSPDLRRWNIHVSAFVLFIVSTIYGTSFCFLPSIVQAITGSPALYNIFLLLFYVVVPAWLVFKMPIPSACGKVSLAVGPLMPLFVTSIVSGRYTAPILVFALIAAAYISANRHDEYAQ